jgi:hypothetical protein
MIDSQVIKGSKVGAGLCDFHTLLPNPAPLGNTTLGDASRRPAPRHALAYAGPGEHRDDMHPPSTGSGRAGGTAARRDCVRVFEQLSWLKLVPLKWCYLVPGEHRDGAQSRPPALITRRALRRGANAIPRQLTPGHTHTRRALRRGATQTHAVGQQELAL